MAVSSMRSTTLSTHLSSLAFSPKTCQSPVESLAYICFTNSGSVRPIFLATGVPRRSNQRLVNSICSFSTVMLPRMVLETWWCRMIVFG